MSNFERVGVNLQYDALTLEEANKKFERSCECCCSKGRHADCDSCHIAATHNLVVAYFNDKAKEVTEK